MLFVYITFPNRREAKRVGAALVGEKLAKCVNIIPEMHSIFLWKGKVEKADECILIAKINERNYQKFERRVRELHPYELPCIIAFKPERGLKEFIEWVGE